MGRAQQHAKELPKSSTAKNPGKVLAVTPNGFQLGSRFALNRRFNLRQRMNSPN
jgi:hypothetical protein